MSLKTKNSTHLVIGIGHRARSGKDTAARAILESAPGDNIQVISVFDSVRAMGSALVDTLGIPLPFDHSNPNYGKFYQKFGDVLHTYDPEFKVRALRNSINPETRVIIIPDIRRHSEFDICDVTLRVRKVDSYINEVLATDRDPNHISEIELTDVNWDYTLLNLIGHQSHFEQTAINIYQHIRHKYL